jgi:RNA polymerase sigma factor (sigma-70 family)
MHQSKQQDRFVSVIQTNKGIIYKVANSYCRDAEDRKDLIQEIIIQLWLAFEKYRPEFAITTWIYRVALNVSISFYRREHRITKLNQPLSDEMVYLEEAIDDDKTTEDLDHLQRFIKELKEIDRAVIILYLEGKSYQETADILGLSVKNVSVKVFRIKDVLKQKFSTIKS